MGPTVGGYVIEGEVGRGAMGRVYRARHVASGSLRAIKVLDSNADPELVVRFRREAEALARLGGDSVVAVHETGVAAGRLYFAMDLMPGGSLEGRLRERGKLPWREAASLIARLARTLQRCHELGLIHRDVKPANVLFDAEGRPRLVDFGLARDLGSHSLTETGTAVGTPGYMGPESFRGEPAGPASDVFSLGVVLHELVTGERPFSGTTAIAIAREMLEEKRRPASELADCPGRLDAVIARALAPVPAARHPSAKAFAEALEALVASDGVAPRSSRVAFAAGSVLLLGLPVLSVLALHASRGVATTEKPTEGNEGGTGVAVVATNANARVAAASPKVVEEILDLIGRGLVADAKKRIDTAPLDAGQVAAVVSAALRCAEGLAPSRTRIDAAIAVYELGRGLVPGVHAPQALVAAAHEEYAREYMSNAPPDARRLQLLEVALRGASQLEDHVPNAKTLASLAVRLHRESVIDLPTARRALESAMGAVPEHPSLGLHRWDMEPDQVARAASYEAVCGDLGFDDERLGWTTIAVAEYHLARGAPAAARLVVERAAAWPFFREMSGATRRKELFVRLTAYRALAALRTDDRRRARELVDEAARDTGSRVWQRIADTPDSKLDEALAERGKAQENLPPVR